MAHKGVTSAMVALLLVAGAAALAAAPSGRPTPRLVAASSPPGPTVPLSHAGRWITDADGRVVMVHGANMVTKQTPYDPAGVGFGEDDARFLERHGFTVVRVGLMWTALEPRPGRYDASYVRALKGTVDLLAKHGIFSLLDSHQDMYNEEFQGLGFPDWAVQDGGLANPQLGFPANYVGNPALQHAEDAFWSNAKGPGGVGLQDRYAAAWAYVAKAFKNDQHVLGYELMNEPAGGDFATCLGASGCPELDKEIAAFGARVTRAIRKVDPRTLIWEEPDVGFNGGTSKVSLPALRDKRSGFSFHPYCYDLPTTGTSPDCDAANDRVVTYALAHVASSHQALMATEFGATGDQAELVDEVQRLDRSMIPWADWAYWDGGTSTTPAPSACSTCSTLVRSTEQPPTGTNVVPGVEAALTEPYPYVVAGTPTAYGYDPDTHLFTASYSTRRAGATTRFATGSETVFEVPSYDYPTGYVVTVRGAVVVSRSDAPVLVLSAEKGATTVDVTITPRLLHQ